MVVIAATHTVTAEARAGVRLWLLGDGSASLARLVLLMQPGVLMSGGIAGLTPAPAALINATLIIASAALHTLSLRAALDGASGGSARLLLLLPLIYAVFAPLLPLHEMRIAAMLACTVLCVVWTFVIVWPHRHKFRSAWLIAGTMAFFFVMSVATVAALSQAPAATSARQQLPPLQALLIDLVSALLMTMSFLVMQFERMHHKIDLLSTTDVLTGARNRRGFMQQLELQWDLSRRHRTPLSIAIFDLDHFKRINDTLGHARGDAVLTGFVARVQGGMRSTDVLARWGGEEFVVLMPNTNQATALLIIDRLRAAVAASPLAEGTPVVTVSGGVTGLPTATDGNSQEQMISRADASLYRAKRVRNCIVSDGSNESLAA